MASDQPANAPAQQGPVELLVVGGGNMGGALVAGLLAAGTPPADIAVLEVDEARRDHLTATHGVSTATEAIPSRGAILATKPAQVPDVAAAVAAAGNNRLLSVAAGVSIASIERAADGTTPSGRPVVRAMPNTPALVGQGAAAYVGNAAATEADLNWAETILTAVGKAVRVTEPLLDAVTGLSGSGPAYVFLVAEALIEAGVREGLTRTDATALVAQTLRGSAELLAQTVADGGQPAELRAQVTSPGGTTAAGLFELESAGVRAALANAVRAATERSVELGRAAAS